MIGLVVCTHRNLAEALVETSEMIVGAYPQAAAVGVEPKDGPDAIRERLEAAVREVDSGDGVMVMCDMFGGTPSNLALSLLSDRVEVVTGVNLPMLLKFFTARTGELAEVARTTREHARDNILVAGELLGQGGR